MIYLMIILILGAALVLSGGVLHEIRNLKESKVPVNALYSSPFRDDTEVCKTLSYTVYGILHTVYCILYSAFCILYTVNCILYTLYCTLYSVFCIL
jgi:hypothetical protein